MTAGALSTVGRALDRGQRRLRFRTRESRFNPWRTPVLRPEAFAGRRVIIVGPADTVFEDLEGTSVDDHDVVVRLNSGILIAERHPEVLGTRTDVLFHNFKETGPRAAGGFSPDLLRRHGVGTCVFPHWGGKGSKRRFHDKRAALRELPEVSLKVLPIDFCEELRRALGTLQPTVGANALLFFARCDLEELAVHGFTFFRSPYVGGYNDAVRSEEEAQAWARASGVHAPDRERELIAQRLGEAQRRGLPLTLGRNVRRHLFA